MNKFIELLIGIILVVAPILIVLYVPLFGSWGKAALEVIKGSIVLVLIVLGLLFIILAASDMREGKPKTKKKK